MQRELARENKDSDACSMAFLQRPIYQIMGPTPSLSTVAATGKNTAPDTSFDTIAATSWQHDPELGRGYLLISTKNHKGKVWRWETGGGPIPIGRTLHLLDSGCRSQHHLPCATTSSSMMDSLVTSFTGSGGITTDISQEPARLIVAEWGEQRIARLEPETGARTPLIQSHYTLQRDSVNGNLRNDDNHKVFQPRQLLYMPHSGDLLVLDSMVVSNAAVVESDQDSTISTTTDILWQLPKSHKIPPLKSLAESRHAHGWTTLMPNMTNKDGHENDKDVFVSSPQMLLQQTKIGGIALFPDKPDDILVTMTMEAKNGSSIVLIRMSLNKNDDDDDDDNDENHGKHPLHDNKHGKDGITIPSSFQSEIIMDYSQYTTHPGPISVDNKGHLYLATDTGILIVQASGQLLGRIFLPFASEERIVSLTLGGDRFLYIATASRLYRMQVRNKPYTVSDSQVAKNS